MKTIDTILIAMWGLRSNASRSALTILGIVIGIMAIIIIMSIGRGAQELILNEISGLGAESIIVRPGKEPTGPSDFGHSLFADSLKKRDIEALQQKRNAPHIAQIMPLLIVPGSVSYDGETYRPQIIGGSAEFFSESFRVSVASGVAFDDVDIQQQTSVAVLGSAVAQELFGAGNAVGEHITIKDRTFRVVGVFPKKGQAAFFNVNELVIIPYTTAQTYLLGTDYFHEAIVKADSTQSVNQTVLDIERTLREIHGIENPQDDDFFVTTQTGVIEQVQKIIGTLTLFLSSVVAIALIVGGIGVMNIMLVSVTQRTREIGLRKALGATEQNILAQFLCEAIALTTAGGIIGIVLGALTAFLISIVLTQTAHVAWVFRFPVSAAVLGLSVSSGVGLVFGLYPALQASRMDPIKALRYE